ncbi:hypothetical protein [Granulicella sp. S156]|jgi:hypothetical protein|uniref:DUF6916 family protein n=1 Tax=Granulicella sp. S156 TaxID=1747224 RepID=UPI00131EA190|nr:hypothetical protein [Granulicella sp. S156]
MSSRRHFLAATAATITLAALPKSLFAERLGGDVFTNASLGAYAQGLLTQATFEKHIGSVFTAFLEDDAVGYLTLQKVVAQPAGTSALSNASSQLRLPGTSATVQQQVTSFHLTFGTKAVFTQDTYLLDHGILGRFAAFLVPGDSVKGNGSCGATFSYLESAVAPTTKLPVSLHMSVGTFN